MDPSARSNRLKFGVDLFQVYRTNGYHPTLEAMFDLLEESSDRLEYSNSQEEDVAVWDCKSMRDIKKRLQAGHDISFQKYPPIVVLGVLQNFLKHLPEPLLHRELYKEWIILGRMLQQTSFYNPKKIALLNVKIMRLLDEELRFEEYLLLRKVIFTLRSLALDKSSKNQCFNIPKLDFLTYSFASVLLRKRINSNSSKDFKVNTS